MVGRGMSASGSIRGGARPARRTATAAVAAAALAGLALTVPAAASAQQADSVHIDTPYEWIERGFRVGAVGGYMDTGLTRLDLGPQSTPTGGLRARARVSSPLSLEAGLLYGESDRFAVDPRLPTGPAPVDTLTSKWILAEAAMQFAVTGNRTWHGLQPYALLGGGFLLGFDEGVSPAFAAPEDASLRHDIQIMPAVQAGVGAEWIVSDRFGVALEFRDHLWRITTPDGFFTDPVLDQIEDADAPAPEETVWTHNLEFSLTVYRYF